MRTPLYYFLVFVAFPLTKSRAFRSERPPRTNSIQKQTIGAVDHVPEVSKNCPFSAAVDGLQSAVQRIEKDRSAQAKIAATAASLLAWQHGISHSLAMATVGAGVFGVYALDAYFESLKKFDGPSLMDIPGLILDVLRSEGLVNLLGRLSEQYGGKAFSIGPLAILTSNHDSIRAMFHNTKMPITVLPGLPRNSGLSSDSPQVTAQCLKAFVGLGIIRKEGSGRIISNMAGDVKEIMNRAARNHGDIFHFREAIAVPVATASNRELVFGSSLESESNDLVRDRKAEVELQALAAEVANLFGAEGITKTLLQPWSAVSVIKNYIGSLDTMVSSAPNQSSCPLGMLKESVAKRTIKQTDAIATAGVFTYFGVDAVMVTADSVIRILAHPDNAELQDECRKEVDGVLAGRRKVVSSGEHVADCHLLKSTIAEVMRCYNMGSAGVAIPPRVAVRDFDVDGTTLTKGSVVMVTSMDNEGASIATGNEEWVSSPSKFNPKAWLDADKEFDERLLNQFTFFGAGARKCPGRKVGFDTVVSIIASTLSYFDDISLLDGQDVPVPTPDRKLRLEANVRDDIPSCDTM